MEKLGFARKQLLSTHGPSRLPGPGHSQPHTLSCLLSSLPGAPLRGKEPVGGHSDEPRSGLMEGGVVGQVKVTSSVPGLWPGCCTLF